MDQTQPERHRMLFSGSIGFYEAARSLYEVCGEFHWPAFFVNMSYAAELSIKAFIMLNTPSADDKMLQNVIRHDLNKGLKFASNAGYVPPTDITAELFDMLHKHHVNHNVRYLYGPPVDMKPHALMLAAMAHHLETIGNQMAIPIKLRVPLYTGD